MSNNSKKAAPSRSAESRRERRIIRNYLRASIYFNFIFEMKDNDALAPAADRLASADALLSTLTGYEKSDRSSELLKAKLVNASKTTRVEVAPNVFVRKPAAGEMFFPENAPKAK